MSLAFVPCSHIFVSEINSPYKDTSHTEKMRPHKSVSEIKFTNKDVTRTKNMRRNFSLRPLLLMNSIITAPLGRTPHPANPRTRQQITRKLHL